MNCRLNCYMIVFTMVFTGVFLTNATAEEPAISVKVPTAYRVYIGTYTGGASKGIYQGILNLKTGEVSTPELAAEVVSPSFLAIHPNGKFLYAVTEIADFQGKKAGGVGAFAIDQATGKLKLLNQQSSGGGGPCHIVVDRLGQYALVANYGGGSCGTLPIKVDGSLLEMASFVQHTGTSVNKSRQSAPHAHSINLDPRNRFAYVADLGLDKVLIYAYDQQTGKLTPNTPPAGEVEPGSGPRHFAFHPSGKQAYVINEITCTITCFTYEDKQGSLVPIQTITTLPNGFDGKNYSTAEVQVHPTGRFVYGSNREHNSIAIFSSDPQTGKLTPVGHQKENIKTPRNFGIDPTGQYLIVANQDGDSLTVFRIDLKTGLLNQVGNPIPVPKPVCVKFLAVK